MRKKFGFRTFIQSAHPIAHPTRPFDKFRDLKASTSGLWCYLTPSGLTSKRTQKTTTKLAFVYYTEGKTKAYVYLPELERYRIISVEAIHTADEARLTEIPEVA